MRNATIISMKRNTYIFIAMPSLVLAWVSSIFIIVSTLLFDFINPFELFSPQGSAGIIYVLATFAVSNIILFISTTKRLKDAGLDPGWSSLSFIPVPLIWSILVIVLMFKPSKVEAFPAATIAPQNKATPVLFLIFLLYLASVLYLFVYQSDPYRAYFSERVGDYGSHYYVVTYPTHRRVFYSYSIHGFSSDHILKNSDPSSFTVLNENFAKDKNYVYYGNENGSPRQIPITGEVKFLNKNYFSTGDNIYFNGQELPSGAGEAVVLDDNYIARGEKVYFQNKELVGAAASKFRFAGSEQYGGARIAKSDNTVYFGPAVIQAKRDGLFLKQSERLPIDCVPDQLRTVAAIHDDRYLSEDYGLGEVFDESYDLSNESRNANIAKIKSRLAKIKICKITETGEDEPVLVDTETLRVVSISPGGDTYFTDKNHVYFGYFNSDHLYGRATATTFRVVAEANDAITFPVDTDKSRAVSDYFGTGCRDIKTFWDEYGEAAYPEIVRVSVSLEKDPQNYKRGEYCFYSDYSYKLPEYR